MKRRFTSIRPILLLCLALPGVLPLMNADGEEASINWKELISFKTADFTPEQRMTVIYERMAAGNTALETSRMRWNIILEQWDGVMEVIDAQPETERPELARLVLSVVSTFPPAPQPDLTISAPPNNAKNTNKESVPTAKDSGRLRNIGIEQVLQLLAYLPVENAAKDTPLAAACLRPFLLENPVAKTRLTGQLEAGLAGWGGASEEGRMAAMSLMTRCGQPILARLFLPPLEEVRESGNLELVWIHYRGMWASAVASDSREQILKCWELMGWMNNLSDAKWSFMAIEHNELRMNQAYCLPWLETSAAQAWIRNHLDDAGTEQALVETILKLEKEKSRSPKVGDREKILILNTVLANELLRMEAAEPIGRTVVLGQLVAHWQREVVQGLTKKRETEQYMQRYRYYSPSATKPPLKHSDPGALDMDTIYRFAPSETLIENLALADRSRLFHQKALLAMEKEEYRRVLDIIAEIQPLDPKVSNATVEELFKSCNRNFNPNKQETNRNVRKPASGVPLTRARQERNLMQLRQICARLRDMDIHPDSEKVVAVFQACHSTAEVYRFEDIERVFHPLEEMPVESAFQLASAMRELLGKAWQDPKIQQSVGTNRTPDQITEEVKQGYDTLHRFIAAVGRGHPDHWMLPLFTGVVAFDSAEYGYANGILLEEYAPKRDAAFAAIEEGCARYRKTILNVPGTEPTVQPWTMWYTVIMQCSSLSLPKPAIEAGEIETNVRSQVARLRISLEALPEGAFEMHRDMLTRSIYNMAVAAGGEVKVLWLKRFYKEVLGLHTAKEFADAAAVGKPLDAESVPPMAEPILKLLDFYDELLAEINLKVRIDGSATVPESGDFGVYILVEHTPQLARESGGFVRYLSNFPNARPPAMCRNDFEKNIREALSKQFEIRSMTFLPPSTRPVVGHRKDWLETPMAYIQLSPKGREVDRIPPLKLVMDFLDTTGQVKLPVESAVVPITVAKEASRPYENLALEQTFDQRKLAEGKAVFDLVATGEGILPDLKTLFGNAAENLAQGKQWQGFTIEKITDEGTRINSASLNDAGRIVVSSERIWKIELKSESLASLPKKFTALVPEVEASSMFRQYKDADLVDEGADLLLKVPGEKRLTRNLLWFLLCMGLLAAGIVVWVKSHAKKAGHGEEPETIFPEEVNPFTATRFLEGLRKHAQGKTSVLEELDADLGKVEAQCFTPAGEAMDEQTLSALCNKWADRLAR